MLGAEKQGVTFIVTYFDWRKGWFTLVDAGMRRFERVDRNTECTFYYEVYEFDYP